MSKEEKSNKIITLVLALVIIIAAFTIIYINLTEETDEEKDDDDSSNGASSDDSDDTANDDIPSDDDSNDDVQPNDDANDDVSDDEIILTLTYKEQTMEYNMSSLEKLESYTGNGGYIKTGWFPEIVTDGPFNYTGVKILDLLNEFTSLPDNYNVTVSSTDQIAEYNYSDVNGLVKIYNGTSTEHYTIGGVSMVLAYKKEGEYLSDSEGPLRIVYLDDEGYTSSLLWSKYVVSIELVEL